MLTERITFGDGSWWEVRTKRTHGMKNALGAIVHQAFDGSSSNGASQIDLSDRDAVNTYLTQHQALRFEMSRESEMVLLIGGTVAWSWDEPINDESILNRDEDCVAKVLARMEELYDDTRAEVASKN